MMSKLKQKFTAIKPTLKYLTWCACGSLASISLVSYADEESDTAGKVEFKVSCNDASQKAMNTGVALLHNMMYLQAEDTFKTAASTDDKCAMLHWGVAMTRFHPLWAGGPSEDDMAVGTAAVEQARSVGGGSPRESAYIEAVSAFYLAGDNANLKERIARWSSQQRSVYEKNRDDVDAAALYALSHLATAPKSDSTFKNQREAGELLETLRKNNPEHPAGFHYLIHAYDNPELANQAEDVAVAYDRLAPTVPHALHMPTHIFTRMGLWRQSINWNRRSAEAATEQSPEEMTVGHYAHAVDYLVYAYLQQGDFKAANEVLGEMQTVGNHQDSFGAAYALAASPVRIALEQEDWIGATSIPVNNHPAITWGKFPQLTAITHFARGLGAARSGNAAVVAQAVTSLGDIHQILLNKKQNYWATLVAAQLKTVEAWAAQAQGQNEKAVELMIEAAELEDSVDKHPVTPGAVLPARELLGDLFVLMDRHEDALIAYESTLKVSPNRARSLRGAQASAAKIGDTERSKSFRDQLNAILQSATEG